MLALVGLPGSGKSTVGRQLAKRIGARFQDSDAVIEARIGMPIRAFFEREGEARFREIETSVLSELAQAGMGVLSTGGGIVLAADNRLLLRKHTTAIYLRTSAEELHRRLRHDTQRPLLQVKDPLAKLRELYEQRDPLYMEVARFVIDTGRPSVPTLVNMILMQLELAGVLDPSRAPSPVGIEARQDRRSR